MEVLALADDMTGALEVGAHFSAQGISTIVSAEPVSGHAATVVVLDTESRHLTPAEAASRVTHFVLQAAAVPPVLVYKKTDSTLRGHIREELLALTRLYPHWTVGYASAYPRLGRTVRNGRLFVDGVAVCQTEFSRDRLNPVLTSSLQELVGPELKARIFDGETHADLEQAARSILADKDMRIAAGPTSLAEQIAMLIQCPRSAPPPMPVVRNCVVLNGSRHPVASAQIECASRDRSVGPDSDALWSLVPNDHPEDCEAGAVARANGKQVLRRVAETEADAVFLIGGDTAFGFIQALGLSLLFPIYEIVPGVPISRIPADRLQSALPGRDRDLLLITKAGGFGAPDLFTQVRNRLDPYA